MSYKKCSNKHILSLFTREPSLGLTPFMEAAAEGHEIIVQLFLQHVSLSIMCSKNIYAMHLQNTSTL